MYLITGNRKGSSITYSCTADTKEEAWKKCSDEYVDGKVYVVGEEVKKKTMVECVEDALALGIYDKTAIRHYVLNHFGFAVSNPALSEARDLAVVRYFNKGRRNLGLTSLLQEDLSEGSLVVVAKLILQMWQVKGKITWAID